MRAGFHAQLGERRRCALGHAVEEHLAARQHRQLHDGRRRERALAAVREAADEPGGQQDRDARHGENREAAAAAPARLAVHHEQLVRAHARVGEHAGVHEVGLAHRLLLRDRLAERPRGEQLGRLGKAGGDAGGMQAVAEHALDGALAGHRRDRAVSRADAQRQHRGGVEAALGRMQRAERVVEHHERDAVGRVHHDAVARGQHADPRGHHGLELGAQARLFPHRLGSEASQPQVEHAGVRRRCGPLVHFYEARPLKARANGVAQII